MKSILYLQKNLFYSTPVVAETINGHLVITSKDGSVILDAAGSNVTARFTAAWGIKLTFESKRFNLYANASGFSPSPSKAQLESVRNNTVTTPYTQPDIAIIDSNQIMKDWRQALEFIHATVS